MWSVISRERRTQTAPETLQRFKYFAENKGRLITKDEIIEAVWQEKAVTDDSLVQCMKDIRNPLGDIQQTLIKTVPRRGYIFESAEERVLAEERLQKNGV